MSGSTRLKQQNGLPLAKRSNFQKYRNAERPADHSPAFLRFELFLLMS